MSGLTVEEKERRFLEALQNIGSQVNNQSSPADRAKREGGSHEHQGKVSDKEDAGDEQERSHSDGEPASEVGSSAE